MKFFKIRTAKIALIILVRLFAARKHRLRRGLIDLQSNNNEIEDNRFQQASSR